MVYFSDNALVRNGENTNIRIPAEKLIHLSSADYLKPTESIMKILNRRLMLIILKLDTDMNINLCVPHTDIVNKY